MRRVETYVGQQVYEWLFSAQAQSTMTGLAKVCAAVFGTAGLANGLPCTATAPASMAVQIGAGELYQMAQLEATTCGTLPADTSHTILKQGIQLGTFTTPTFAAPGSSGQSIAYLIEAQYQDSDISLDPTTGATNIVLQFYNADNPATPWAGPSDSGATSNTFRDGIIAYQIKAGTAATTGTQVTPSPDAGWVGLWVVTVPFGATTLTSSNIAQYTGAPFLTASLLAQIQACALLNGSTSQVFNVAPAASATNAVQFSQVSGVAGQSRNLSMNVAAASATATLTADEIIVETALGGLRYCLPSFSKTINLATTGAGGMDTGTAPVSGFVALYAIWNPTTSTAALLATNATSAAVANVYGGANMPAGFTASALVSVWATNGSSQFKAGGQYDRRVSFPSITVLNNSTINASLSALSVSSAAPKNAKRVYGTNAISSSVSGSTTTIVIAGDTNGSGSQQNTGTITAGIAINNNFGVPVFTSQTIYYQNGNTTGTPTFVIAITEYEF